MLCSFAGFAQVNISEGFESGTLPTGWTSTGFNFWNNGTLSYSGSGYTNTVANIGSNTSLKTPNQISDGNAIDISVMARKNPGPAVSFGLGYELNNSGNLVPISGASENLGTAFSAYRQISGIIPAGAIPAGTTIKFVIYSWGQAGTSGDVIFDDFRAIQASGVGLLPVEYKFDSTRENTLGLNPFTSANTTYTEDRAANPGKAIEMIAGTGGCTANIALLPKGNNARSFSVWYKTQAHTTFPVIFSYGTTNQVFSLVIGGTGNPIVFESGSAYKDFGGVYANNTWQHAVVTYNGSVVKMYMNGALAGTQNLTLNTGNNSTFKIGDSPTTTAIDDLKIFGTVLTDAEVANLYNHNQTMPPTAPVLTYVSKNAAHTTATLSYTINSASGTATSVIKYGLSDTNLNNQANGFTASGTVTGNVTLEELLPGTTYYYSVEATNAIGTTVGATDSFTTSAQLTIAEYTFDNVYTNITGNSPFSIATGVSFTTDRHGNGNAAINVDNTTTNATINGLPTAGMARTVSLWFKRTGGVGNSPSMFVYGTAANLQKFGLYFNNTGGLVFQAYGADEQLNIAGVSSNMWHHIAATYENNTVKIYFNGTLTNTFTKELNTGNSLFQLGNFTGSIDDLKIYNYALTATQIGNLFIHNQITPVTTPVISYLNKTVLHTSATIAYRIDSPLSNATSVIKYGTNSDNLTLQTNGFASNSSITGSVSLDGLSPNTTYYYRVEATNNAGTAIGATDSFTTSSQIAIAEYTFNNVYTNTLGTAPFSTNPGVTFTTDRHGNSNSAINIINSGTTATIPGLPYGNSTRTISFWAKANVLSTLYNMTFSYGTSITGQSNGGSFTGTEINYYGYYDNVSTFTSQSANTWYHFVYVYNGTTAKIYKNGVLAGQDNKNWNTVNNNDIFRLGIGVGNEFMFNGAIDDLKIYNYVLSDTDILSLYNNNMLSAAGYTIPKNAVRLHPNPAHEVLNIDSETEVQKVEIYSIHGQKVLLSHQNQVNVSALPAGIYVVKTYHENNVTTDSKLVIE